MLAGLGHVDLLCRDLDRSLAFYAAVLGPLGLIANRVVAAGGQVLHAPRLWPEYGPVYYATFFLDPDGFRIEIAASRDARP